MVCMVLSVLIWLEAVRFMYMYENHAKLDDKRVCCVNSITGFIYGFIIVNVILHIVSMTT